MPHGMSRIRFIGGCYRESLKFKLFVWFRILGFFLGGGGLEIVAAPVIWYPRNCGEEGGGGRLS